jgi:hypothetical protein
MRPIHRWGVVAIGIAVLISLPWVVAQRPAHDSPIGAAQLLQRIQESGTAKYSGYVESVGGLVLPVTDQVSDVADLLGDRTQARVWWRGPADWRVDRLSVFGETDTHRDADGIWTWNYEQSSAVRTPVPTPGSVRLPDTVDIVPAELARRLLSAAAATEVSRIPAKVIAGRSAVGLRLRPAEAQSSIDHVDVWALSDTGIALRVDVIGKGSGVAAMSTAFLDFDATPPSASQTAFAPTDQARASYSDGFSIVAANPTNEGPTLPASLGGLNRNGESPVKTVGVYGRGVTELVVAPLRRRFAFSLRDQLISAGAVETNRLVSLAVGPINLTLVERFRGGTSWLVVGTVDRATLTAAAATLGALVGG